LASDGVKAFSLGAVRKWGMVSVGLGDQNMELDGNGNGRTGMVSVISHHQLRAIEKIEYSMNLPSCFIHEAIKET
jgi:hypothetical protein